MIRVITVEREYGSQGGEFARLLAEHLKWELLDQSLIEEVAKRAGVPTSKRVGAMSGWIRGTARWVAAFWHGSNERASAIVEQEIFDTTRMTELTQEVMQRRHGPADASSSDVARLVRCMEFLGAFTRSCMPRRRGRFAGLNRHSLDKKAVAERELAATDQRRSDYVEHFYHTVWNDYRIYHLMLNSCMGFDAMIGATIEATGV